MDDIENLKTDANIANILQKLKTVKSTPSTKKVSANTDENDVNKNIAPSLMKPVTDFTVTTIPKKEIIKEEPSHVEQITVLNEDTYEMLPWINKNDIDNKVLHYITFDDSGNIVYNTVRTDRPANDLASLKLRDNYVCDVDYYKSRHYVLYVKCIDSNYKHSRSFTTSNESVHTPELEKNISEDIALTVRDDDKYNHFIVFTDLGVAEFIAKADDVSYPYYESNLSKWFEEISNYYILSNIEYTPNSAIDVESIKDFRYDIITMHHPGVITLDSIDNDSDYKLNISLKSEYAFLPMKRILGCLRYYVTHKEKSLDDFRCFIGKYFNIV
jgi:hypothetical protein